METPTDENRLADVRDIHQKLAVIGDPRDWIKNGGKGAWTQKRAEDVCDDYERLLRIIQLLLLTGRLDLRDLIEATEEEEHLR